jgi:hypothetical protein
MCRRAVQHAITFLPPTACNYFIVHDAEIKFLLLLSNAAAAACRRYNLKIHPHSLRYRLYKLRLSNASTSLAQNCYIVLIILYTDLELRAARMQHKRMRVKGGFVNGGASILSISAYVPRRSDYI